MPVEDFLLENEKILFNSPTKIEYQDGYYEFYLTDLRLVWYKRAGLLSKSDTIIAERIDDILEIKYEEKGFFTKKGAIHIITPRKTLDFASSIETIKAIYQQLQSFIRLSPSIMKNCDQCGNSISSEVNFCPHCGFQY